MICDFVGYWTLEFGISLELEIRNYFSMLFPKLLSFLAILFLFAAPLALFAQGLVPDCVTTENVTINGVQTERTVYSCGFDDVMLLIKNIIDFAILLIMPLAAILFAYAGWLYLSSSVDPGGKSKAHKIFTSVVWGLLWTLGAWLIVKLISDALLQPAYIGLPG